MCPTPTSLSDIPALLQTLGVKPLKASREIYPGAGTLEWEKSPYFQANREAFEKLNRRYGSHLEALDLAPVEVRYLGPEVGYGLFAAADLKRLAWVGEYAGIVDLAQDEEDLTQEDGHFHSDYAWNFPDELPNGGFLEINALKEGNALRFVNHSFSPNLSPDHTLFKGRWITFFRTRRPVKAGEQLTIDYGEEYWATEHRTLVIFEEDQA